MDDTDARSYLKLSLHLQVFAVAAALLLPFGFDRPSELGLDFGHLMLLLVLYGVTIGIGIVNAIRLERFWLALFQPLIPAVIYTALFLRATGS